MRLTAWWDSPEWHAYERAYGDEPGTRARLLADATFRTRLVDLRPAERELWRGVRRSYHAPIHKAERERDLRVFGNADVPSVQANAILHARWLHREQAGRETRSMETWDIMARWLLYGNGLLSTAWHGATRCDGYAYFAVEGPWAYYFSAASAAQGLNAALVWRAMLTAKAYGVDFLELGWQGQAQDDKGQNIEFFRRGFGGVDVDVRSTVEGEWQYQTIPR